MYRGGYFVAFGPLFGIDYEYITLFLPFVLKMIALIAFVISD